MALPTPYQNANDAEIVAGCASSDPDAFAALWERYGRTIQLVCARAAAERDLDVASEADQLVEAVSGFLRGNHAAPFRVYRGRSLLVFLVAVSRRVAAQTLRTPASASPMQAAPDPASEVVFLDAEDELDMVERTLERLPAEATAVVRMRTRGLGRRQIADALARTEASVLETLEQLATHFSLGLPNAKKAWRILLDAASAEERTELALLTGRDERYRRHRAEALAIFFKLAEHVLSQSMQIQPMCLDHHTLSGFRDGSLRGQDRMRAEGHLTGCAHCTDNLASLTLDLAAQAPLRVWARLPAEVSLAAAQVAATRFTAGLELLDQLAEGGGEPSDIIGLVRRVAVVGRSLTVERRDFPQPPAAPSDGPPSDLEAPVLAFEELARGRSPLAFMAIDDLLAKSALGERLRMLAAAAGHDPELGRAIAFDVRERRRVDPVLLEDSQAVLALPEDTVLPKEIVRERLLGVVPDLVRHVLTG